MTPAAMAERNALEQQLRAHRKGLHRKGAWTFDDDAVLRAIAAVERLEPDRIEHWRRQERKGPGGVAGNTPMTALLVAMVLGAVEQLPYQATVYCDILYKHISPKMQMRLGLGRAPDKDDRKAWAAAYRSVLRRLHSLFELMDFDPKPMNRRRSPQEHEALLTPISPEVAATRYERLLWFINQIIEISLQELPREYRRRWNGHVAVDATPIKAYSRPAHVSFKEKAKPGTGWEVVETIRVAADPSAGMYIRDYDHRDLNDAPPGTKAKKRMFAHEASLVIMGPDGPNDDDGSFPYLVVAMAPLHRPGADPGGNAVAALSSLHARGWPAGKLAADRAYTNAKPEGFAYPARALGYEPILDYKSTELGVQGQWQGAILVEGAFYCPSMPPSLISATIDYRNDRITEEQWQARLAARSSFILRANGKPDEGGHVRMLCPAAGTAPTARCDHKKASNRRRSATARRIDLTDMLRNNPPQVCRQQTITMPPTAYDRYGQVLPYGTPEWHAAYSILRNAIEGGNGHLKDASGPAIGEPSRRRIRGIPAQSVFVALGNLSLNLERIGSFLRNCVIGTDGVIRTQAKETARVARLTTPLTAYIPDLPTGDPPTAT